MGRGWTKAAEGSKFVRPAVAARINPPHENVPRTVARDQKPKPPPVGPPDGRGISGRGSMPGIIPGIMPGSIPP